MIYFEGGTIEQLVAEKSPEEQRAQKSLELQKITRKFQEKKNLHLTQQDMFNFMFGEGQISSLIDKEDEERASEEPETVKSKSNEEGMNERKKREE